MTIFREEEGNPKKLELSQKYHPYYMDHRQYLAEINQLCRCLEHTIKIHEQDLTTGAKIGTCEHVNRNICAGES